MAKATTYTFQGKEWSVKDLAEELGLSTHRVYRLSKIIMKTSKLFLSREA